MKLNVISKPFAFSFYCVFVLVLLSVFVNGNDESANKSKRISKRNELEMQFCLENFDIQEDTIIRTQDSRAMGAKYINETDLSSREECLKLCCETTSCDVFVFEEKNPGSCYLFNCGPSDDFKCKFTQHRHYTSAILTINRHAAELENEMQHSKHEQELTRLRVSPNELLPSTPSSAVVVTTISPAPKESSHTAVSANATAAKPGARVGSRESVAFGAGEGAAAEGTTREKCSRYQFECRTTGECIAIYNACDGIPQCADGSDEGSELDCPSSSTSSQIHPQNPDDEVHPHNHPHIQPKAPVTTAETHVVTSPPSLKAVPQALPRHLPLAIESYQGSRGQHSVQQLSASMHQIPQLQQFQPNWAQQQQQQLQNQYHSMGGVNGGYSPEGGDGRLPYPSQHLQQQQHIGFPGDDFPMAAGQSERSPANQWPPFRPGSPSLLSPSGQDWFPHSPMDSGNAGQQYEENGPNRHIFNHKSNGLVSDTDRYIHMRIHPYQYNIPNYGDGTQGEYNGYANNDNKGYVGGGGENYFNTPYRQPAQPNWPLMHQQNAANSNPHQLNDNVKDLREEALSRKHGPSPPNQGLASPNNMPRGDYPQSIPPGSGERRPPVPPDYFYEDGPGMRRQPLPHRTNSNQRENTRSPVHGEVSREEKVLPAHHDVPSAVHAKEKLATSSKGREEEVDDEEEEEEGGGGASIEEEAEQSPFDNKPQHSKINPTPKPAALKQAEHQHQAPVHMTIKHSTNNEGNGDVPDGESSRPKGAILSLTLGMGITAIMVALMTWRIRVIKRRLRRGAGKSPYAHDADYLVNGMYL